MNSRQTMRATMPPVWVFFGGCALSGAAVFALALTRGNALPVAVASGVTSAALLAAVVSVLRVAWSLMVTSEPSQRAGVRVHASTAALRQDKARVLRALKELDFDHELRKISVADFAEIRDQYRLRAIELSRLIDGAKDLHPRTLDVLAQRRQTQSSTATGAGLDAVASAVPDAGAAEHGGPA